MTQLHRAIRVWARAAGAGLIASATLVAVASGCAQPIPAAVPDLSGEIPGDTDMPGARDLAAPPDLRTADLMIVCPGGQKNCGGRCILSSACCLAADCGPAPAHGTFTCSPTTNTCQLGCDAGWIACGKTCIPEQRDGGTPPQPNDGGASSDGGSDGDGGSSMPPGACSTGKPGACAVGVLGCEGSNVICIQTVQPTGETCNGQDDDCNGQVDDGNPGGNQACSTGLKGVCANGTTACRDGRLACNQDVQPSPEQCNRLDDDCDGTVDNGNPGGMKACTTTKPGVCAPGTTACSNGAIVCNQNVQPSPETCDGKDNDCNGRIDDNASIPDGLPNSCMGAPGKAYSVAPGAFADVKGYVDPAGDDYFTAVFTNIGSPGAYYHPKIELTDTGGGQFVMYVYIAGDCGGSAQCNRTLTSFEMLYPNDPQGCKANAKCTDNTTRPAQLVVRVARAAGPPTTCASYTIRLSNI